MRRTLLPIILLTTITLSSSTVLPILSINKLDTEPILYDQDSDNTFNNRYSNENPNIFYKVFIETPKDDKLKKSQLSRTKYMDNENQDTKIRVNGKIENEDNEDSFRKEQWHNYPRQLDRLNKNFNIHRDLDEFLLDTKDLEKLKMIGDFRDDINHYVDYDLGNLDAGAIDGPLLIFKIRLAYLKGNINNADSNKFVYTDLVPLASDADNKKDDGNEGTILNTNDIESFIKVKRKTIPRSHDVTIFENSPNDKKAVKKRIFSLLSRLQSLSHRDHELHHRRHLYALYGLPEDGGGTLTAETRATLMRPPGSPLRWG